MWEGLIVALTSGGLALVGGYVGAYLTRRTEHEKWLRRERSVAFAEVLRQLHVALEQAIPVLFRIENGTGFQGHRTFHEAQCAGVYRQTIPVSERPRELLRTDKAGLDPA